MLVLVGLGVLIVSAWLVLTVVGGKSSGKLNPIAQAAERTAAYPGERMTLSASLTSSVLPEPLQMQGHGAFNGQTQSGRMTVVSQMPPPINQITLDEVMQGSTIYMTSPLFTEQLPDGKSWIKIDVLSGQDQTTGTFGQSDPQAQLEMLKAVSDQFALVGHKQIRGASTSHYRTAIDTGKEAALLRSEGNDQAADLFDKLPSTTGTSQIPVEVWIDGRHLVRRLQTTMPLPDANGPGASMNMTMDFFDFGAAPQVAIPPSSEVFDATDLAQQGLDQFGQ